MARPRNFDEPTAIERAMEAFWSGGYEGTSTEQLCEATGLGRSSIYNTFASKQELFRKTLRRYDETTSRTRAEILEGPGTARERLRRFLQVIIEDELEHNRRGCLAVNTVVELGRREPEITAELARDIARFVDDLKAVLDQGRRDGEIDRDKDTQALAQFLHATVGGLRVQARLGLERGILERTADVALTAL
jgi:TetR/AcrR family transcriptional regulator, transcriptional repressor for nem operon